MTATEGPRIIAGVDGSEASVEALRVAATLAEPLGATVEAWACWDVPAGYGVYLAVSMKVSNMPPNKCCSRRSLMLLVTSGPPGSARGWCVVIPATC